MLSPIVAPAELVTGQRMNVAEFLSRWEDLPDLKNAELIDGVVYVPSPVSLEHGSLAAQIIWWLAWTGKSYSESFGREVTGAATKSSSPASRRTAAGRTPQENYVTEVHPSIGRRQRLRVLRRLRSAAGPGCARRHPHRLPHPTE